MDESTRPKSGTRPGILSRLRLTTWLLVLLLLAIAVALNWPTLEVTSSPLYAGLSGGDDLHAPAPLFAHQFRGSEVQLGIVAGFPFHCYSRRSIGHDLPSTLRWSVGALVANAFTVLTLVALTAAWWEWRCARMRRWLQVSLTDAAFAVLLLSVPLTWYSMQRTRYDRERQLSGYPNTRLHSACQAPWWLAKMVPDDQLRWCDTITAVHCWETTGDLIRKLECLPGLRSLRLTGGNYAAEDLASLAALPQLRHLELKAEADGEAIVRAVAKLTRLESVTLTGETFDSSSLVPIASLRRLRILDIKRTAVDDAAMTHIGRIRSLEILRLPARRFDGSGLVHLHDHPSLRALQLAGRVPGRPTLEVDLRRLRQLESLHLITEVTRLHLENLPEFQQFVFIDECTAKYQGYPHLSDVRLVAGHVVLRDLPALPSVVLYGGRLKSLELTNLPRLHEFQVFYSTKNRPHTIPSEIVQQIGRTTSLQSLDLPLVVLDSEHMASIGRLENLRRLCLAGAEINDQDIRHLSRLMTLETLDLTAVHIGDEAFSYMPRMEHLKSLHLSNTDITDHGLKYLIAKCPQLEFLNVKNTQVTDDGVRRLKEALPDLAVDHPH